MHLHLVWNKQPHHEHFINEQLQKAHRYAQQPNTTHVPPTWTTHYSHPVTNDGTTYEHYGCVTLPDNVTIPYVIQLMNALQRNAQTHMITPMPPNQAIELSMTIRMYNTSAQDALNRICTYIDTQLPQTDYHMHVTHQEQTVTHVHVTIRLAQLTYGHYLHLQQLYKKTDTQPIEYHTCATSAYPPSPIHS